MLITNEDLMLVLQQSSATRAYPLKVEVLDKNKQYVGEIEGLVSGATTIEADSDIRRTANIVVSPTCTQHIKLEEGGLLWLDKDIRMYVGLYNVRTKTYKYYPLGYYVYTDTSATYDATTNQLTINCADFMKKLDGTKNGQLGALKVLYPAYEIIESEEGSTDEEAIAEKLIPVMTSNTEPSGTVTQKNYASTSSMGYKAFDGNAATAYLGRPSEEATNVHNEQWLKYEFDTPVCVDNVTVLLVESDYAKNTYAVTIYLDLIDSDGNVLTTLSRELTADDALETQTFEFDRMSGVKSVKLYYSNRVVQNTASGTVYHVSCAEMQVYGFIDNKDVDMDADISNSTEIKYNTIRNAVIETLEKLANIKDYLIDDIGEFYAMPENNDDWEAYRERNEDTWNTIPFDQEFECGCSVLSILTTFRDLYPNYEMFFEPENNTFICQLIPSCYDDDIILDNNFFQKVLISENSSVDLTTVKNICEVWGQVLETDFYTEEVTYTDNVYKATVEGYIEIDKDGEEKSEYKNNDVVSLKVDAPNLMGASININDIGNVPILNEGDDSSIEEGVLKGNNVYTFKIKKKYDKETGDYIIKAYLLGQWQVHAINVLTDGTVSTQQRIDSEGVAYDLYSMEYFKHFYNCERVTFEIVPDSPFTVQKLGEILDVKTSGEYENITSDDLASERARWENWKNCRLTDNITLTTVLLPFLDVNIKVSYKPVDANEEHQYIVKSVSHDFTNGTSSITMMRFYPLYIEDDVESGTYEILGRYTYEQLGLYTHEQLQQLKG